ncbi:putative Rossmann fold flavoprotein [Desulfohalotomaculum tongense]|uniref:NAD(P)/FAD-dependent oxidoreductase n=1 Tax=Desulforadius tongensis TaxID=1216062 RepID=UPI003B75D1E3|nr:putative Rossmann fold flavoprotein [Desulforadius tongensis]
MIKVIVVGGGAAGLMAGLAAVNNGAEVTILERMPRVGKKILATGNGRCNLTNVNLTIENYHGQKPNFALGALNRFNVQQTIDYFEYLGIAHKVEERGKVYPMSDQASSVLDVLRFELQKRRVNIITETEVTGIEKINNSFILTTKNEKKYRAHRVIIATGGKCYPNLGSNGSGYNLARKLGHSIVEPFPALVQVKLAEKFYKQIKGIKFIGDVEVLAGSKTIAGAAGEILFTEYGVSGPPVLDISRTVNETLHRGKEVWLKLVLLKNISKGQLEELLIYRFQTQPQKTLAFSFVGLINKQLAPVVLKQAGIKDINKLAGNVTAEERKKITAILHDWRLKVTGTKGWTSAQVTAGGVSVKEINPKTMQSKLVPGLFFAGEVVDIDGDCGGFNLQWAWSSGYVAGENAAKGSDW